MDAQTIYLLLAWSILRVEAGGVFVGQVKVSCARVTGTSMICHITRCFSTVSQSCAIPCPFFQPSSLSSAFLGWIRAEKDSFVFLGEPLNLLLERRELPGFSPLQIQVITHELILMNSAPDLGAVPCSSCENERDLLSPHHPPSASECLSLA